MGASIRGSSLATRPVLCIQRWRPARIASAKSRWFDVSPGPAAVGNAADPGDAAASAAAESDAVAAPAAAAAAPFIAAALSLLLLLLRFILAADAAPGGCFGLRAERISAVTSTQPARMTALMTSVSLILSCSKKRQELIFSFFAPLRCDCLAASCSFLALRDQRFSCRKKLQQSFLL